MNKTITSFLIAACMVASPTAQPQERNCKFLNESCDTGSYRKKPEAKRSFSEHLDRCLAYYVKRWGQFVPEGQSTHNVKSKSDWTAMCKGSIAHHNFFWDYPVNQDYQANFSCCMKYYRDEKACQANLRDQQNTVDFCDLVGKADNGPPREWGVPPGCTSGTCMITPGYCQYVGYSRLHGAAASSMIASLRASAANADRVTQEQLQATLRVCFGLR